MQEPLLHSTFWTLIRSYAEKHPAIVLKKSAYHYFLLMVAYLQDVMEELDPNYPIDIVIPEPQNLLLTHYLRQFWGTLPKNHPVKRFSTEIVDQVRSSVNPTLIICHSFFSLQAQSLLFRKGGTWHSGCLNYSLTNAEGLPTEISYAFETRPCSYPTHPLLRYYDRLSIPLLFPDRALALLEEWDHQTRGRMLVLLGDSGPTTRGQAESLFNCLLSPPSSLPLMTNFHALSLWAQEAGGNLLVRRNSSPRWVEAVLLTAGSPIRYPCLCRCYEEDIARFSTQDLQRMVQVTLEQWYSPPASFLLKLLKLSLYDPRILARIGLKLHHTLTYTSETDKQLCAKELSKVYDSLNTAIPEHAALLPMIEKIASALFPLPVKILEQQGAAQ